MAPSEHPFSLSEHDQRFVDAAHDLAADVASRAAVHDDEASLPVENLEALHAAGFDEAVLPAELGGGGLTYQAFGEIVRTLSQADPSTATLWVMHTGAGVGLAQLTRETRGSFFADEFLAGKRFSNALSEPTSGNRFFNPQQVAHPVEGGFALTGAKRFVSGSEIADYLFVNALADGEIAFFGVEPDDTVSIIPIWDTLGMRGTRSQLLSFDNTVLRHENRGRAMQPTDFNAIGNGLPMISLGVADAALAALIAHAQGRMIMGAPLSHQQWVQYEVADVQSRLEAVRSFIRVMLWQADNGLPEAFENGMRAKLLANRIAVDVAQLGVRIGGASGFLKSSPIQRHLRDAEAGQLMAYSTEVLSGLVGRATLGVPEQP